MSKFSKKAKSTNDYESNVDFDAFNAHLEEVINEATDDGENTNQVCIVSGIIDAGTQTMEPDEEYTVYPWEDSERQHNLLKADFGCYEEDGKFYIPNKTVKADSVIIMVDFPTILVDYGKFFNNGESDVRPYRALLAGEWDNIAQYTMLNSQGYSSKSRIYKLAKATGLHKTGQLSGNFDVGELLGQVFTMDIIGERSNDGKFYNVKISNISSKHKAIPVPEYSLEPFGIMMNGENDPTELNYLRKSVIRRLELADEWEESDLKKQLEELSNKPTSKEPQKAPEKISPKKDTKVAPKKKAAENVSDELEEDIDTDIPF